MDLSKIFGSANVQAILGTFGPLLILVLVFYFMIIRPQRKRDKQTKEMLASLKVGDKIVTIGGVTGKITRIKDNSVVISTADEATKIEFERWSIKEVTTIKDV